MKSTTKDLSYRLGRRPGKQGPLQKVLGVPTVVTASAYYRQPLVDDGDNVATGNACKVSSCRCGHHRCLTCLTLKTGSSFTSSITAGPIKCWVNRRFPVALQALSI